MRERRSILCSMKNEREGQSTQRDRTIKEIMILRIKGIDTFRPKRNE